MDNSTMKNTLTLNDTAFSAQAPDRAAMTRSLQLMRNSLVKADLLFAKTQYLPNLYEKLTRLNILAVTE
ncbi:chemotaxis protein, partial [Pseudomonas syringae]|nr:chemotaxis protein [Pseudomonas syringae]